MAQILTAAGRTRWGSAMRGLNPHIVDLGVYDAQSEMRYGYDNAVYRWGSAGDVYHQQDVITQTEKDAVTETGGPGVWTNLYGVFDGVYSDVARYTPKLYGYPYVDFDFGEKTAWYRYTFQNPYGSDYATSCWLYGSNIDTAREDNLLHSASGLGAGTQTFDISTSNLGNYRYWRLKGYSSASVWWRLYEVYFYRLPQYIFVNVPSQHRIEVYDDASLTHRRI
ncbi:MAG: hypothetical protein KAJ73_03260 [Zetaproteobacteria bacterium]|nr:hypothetical protein [Zetaproteobacteria bacterium]